MAEAMMEPEGFEEPMDVDVVNVNPYQRTPELNQSEFLQSILPYMSVKDLKKMRLVSQLWNRQVTHEIPWRRVGNRVEVSAKNPRFSEKIEGTLKTTWYDVMKGLPEFNYANTIPWTCLHLEHFKIYKKSTILLNYWPYAGALLQELILDSISLECDCFRFLLDFVPNLRTLKMKKVKLRDLADHHNNFTTLMPPVIAERDAPPIRNNITHLSFQDMGVMESCFFDYLVERTGAIEFLSIKNCFNKDPDLAPDPNEPDVASRAFDFQDSLVFLLEKNHKTLSRLTLSEILFMDELLSRLVEECNQNPATFPFPEDIKVSFGPETMTKAGGFFQTFCRNVTNFKLNLMPGVPNDQVVAVLNLMSPNIVSLRVSVFGGESCPDQLNIANVLPRFIRLKEFEIQDRRKMSMDERRLIRMRHRLYPYRFHRGLGKFAGRLRETLERVHSRVNLDAVLHLPPSVTRISIDKVFNYNNIFGNPLYYQGMRARFRLITSLEIRGPWFFPLTDILQLLYLNGALIEKLVMTSCAIHDTDITGLCRDASQQMRRALTYVQSMYAGIEKDRARFDDLVASAPADWDKNRNLARPGYIGPSKKKLSDLKNLQHLDLSFNPNVTDVGIYQGFACPKLKTLGLHSCEKITDLGLELLSLNCPNLEVLNIKNIRRVSPYGIDNVVRKCKNIKRIYTTRIIERQEILGFGYLKSPHYNNVVKTSIWAPMENLKFGDDVD